MSANQSVWVTLVWSDRPRHAGQLRVAFSGPVTVRAVLQKALADGLPPVLVALPVSLWGRRVGQDDLVQDQDRLELTRPLRVDPKLARRQRFKRQGERKPGLFARAAN